MGVRLTFKMSNTLGRVAPTMRSEARRITSGGLRLGEVVAKQHARVDTGYMRSQVRVRMTGPYSGALDALASYSIFVERRYPFMSIGARAAADFISREWASFERKVPRA